EAEARLGDFKAAEETALGIDPDRWAVDESLLTIAKVHLERGEFQKAQQMTARMKNAFAKAKGYALLASASGHAGERKRGVEQLAIALQFADKLDDESESDVTLGLVAVAQLELNVPDQANRTLQRIRSEDHLAEAIPGIAKALRTETRQSLQRAIRFANTTTNDTTRTFEIIAIVHARLDDTMSAKKIVAERLRGDYNRSEAYARIAEFESQKGGCSEAIETFNRIPFDQPMAKGKALAAVAESTVLTDKPPVMARDADKIKTLADEGRPIPERQASLEAFATQLGLPDDIAFFHLGAARGIARLMGHKDLVAE
ncbi:MAG: hypothetical protein NTW03_03070, partial [Verrucomicrobia bacterium]|nr:hypothetical protein [Verrucomicrobiota bacterium]